MLKLRSVLANISTPPPHLLDALGIRGEKDIENIKQSQFLKSRLHMLHQLDPQNEPSWT